MQQQHVVMFDTHLQAVLALKTHLQEHILGQEALIDRLLIALLADGHLLVEGAPGLAKTKAIKTLASGLEGKFHRVQFTPDLLPSDITGTDIFRAQTGEFVFQPGPLFHNIILADEINRAPAKVQSALLEAMGERQITVGQHTYALPALYLVMATQNPIEHEGTYPLPEAQLDRFLLFVKMDYPHAQTEQQILQLARKEALQPTSGAVVMPRPPLLTEKTIMAARQAILHMHMSPAMEQYVVQFILATRSPEKYCPDLARMIRYGASVRGTLALDRCARAHAWLQQREFVSPQDMHAIAKDVLRHRILLTFEAQADGVDVDEVIDRLLRLVPLP